MVFENLCDHFVFAAFDFLRLTGVFKIPAGIFTSGVIDRFRSVDIFDFPALKTNYFCPLSVRGFQSETNLTTILCLGGIKRLSSRKVIPNQAHLRL